MVEFANPAPAAVSESLSVINVFNPRLEPRLENGGEISDIPYPPAKALGNSLCFCCCRRAGLRAGRSSRLRNCSPESVAKMLSSVYLSHPENYG